MNPAIFDRQVLHDGDSGQSVVTCLACGSSSEFGLFTTEERMFGTGERFAYACCAKCSIVQLCQPYPDFSKHYPANYYSLAAQNPNDGFPKWRWRRRWLTRSITNHRLGRWSPLGGMLARRFLVPSLPDWVQQLVPRLRLDSRILDVGCGSGRDLLTLRDCGFKSLRGTDPFNQQPLAYAGNVRIDTVPVDRLEGEFDLITLHHVFEHVVDQAGTLRHLHRLLAPEGMVLLRLPLSDSEAFETYGAEWVQLDAPRHVALHTKKSLSALAGQTGFRVESVRYDSTAFQFWGSEQYKRGIALRSPESFAENPEGGQFTKAQMAAWTERARQLNLSHRGDQAGFVLRKAV